MKTAGSSVTTTLDSVLDWRDLVLGGTELGEKIHRHYERFLGIGKHSRAIEIRDVMGEELWEDYFTFSFVRHPYTRAVSLYLYIKKYVESSRRDSLKNILSAVVGRRTRFRKHDWLNDLPEATACLRSKTFTQFLRYAREHGSVGLRPQVEWLTDENGKLMVDFVGRVETLDADFRSIRSRIGLGDVDLSKVNRSSRTRPWHAFYESDEDFRIVAEMMKEDFSMLGYDPLYKGVGDPLCEPRERSTIAS